MPPHAISALFLGKLYKRRGQELRKNIDTAFSFSPYHFILRAIFLPASFSRPSYHAYLYFRPLDCQGLDLTIGGIISVFAGTLQSIESPMSDTHPPGRCTISATSFLSGMAMPTSMILLSDRRPSVNYRVSYAAEDARRDFTPSSVIYMVAVFCHEMKFGP